MSKRFLTTAEVTKILDCHRHTLYSWVKRKHFPAAYKMFGAVLFWDFDAVKSKLKADHERINAAWYRLREVERQKYLELDSALLLEDSAEDSA